MQRDYIALSTPRWQEFQEYQRLGLIPRHGDFSPAGVHYPPITNYPPIPPEEAYRDFHELETRKFDVYVHIPFCHRRCLFCHYPSHYHCSESEKDIYLDHLEMEMRNWLSFRGIERIKSRTILMGGGTPTDLSPSQLKRFLTFFTKYVDITSCPQFNWDVDPSTLVGEDGLERLRIIKDYQGDRLTIGIQSLNDAVLRKMNRSHDVAVAKESIQNCLNMGFKVNIEFIYGHPGETLQNWIDVMEEACSLGTDEIQLYRLKIEPYGDQEGTIKKFSAYHEDELISVEDTIRMKEISDLILADHGYQENLRRVFTKNRKNISLYAYNQCCRLKDEVGFGLSAFSSLNDRFMINTPDFAEYYQRTEQGMIAANRCLIRNADQQARWSTILPLKNYFIDKQLFQRLNQGADVSQLFRRQFDLLLQYGLITEDDKRVELTPTGAFYSDEIVHLFYEPQHQSFPRKDFMEGSLNPFNI
ncbi:MAG: radical SAM protein [Bacteroidaceae bacterium]|nr:radical SAM protein [Bacteroidaceae bacterium]